MTSWTVQLLAQISQAPPAPGGGSSNTTSYLLIAMSAGFILYVAIRPMFTRKKDPLSDAPFRMSLSQNKSIEREMQTLIVELHEMSRKMGAQIETRAARLEQLIADADQRLGLLKKLGQLDDTDLPPLRPAVTAADDRPRMRLVRSDEPAVEQQPAAPASPGEFSNVEMPDDRHRPVYELADAGLSPAAIAQRLARPAGEIELILALRPRAS